MPGEVVVNVPLHTVAVESTTVSPVGRASKNATPVSVVDGLGFVIVKSRLVVALNGMVEGLNCLAILGGDCAKAGVAYPAMRRRTGKIVRSTGRI